MPRDGSGIVRRVSGCSDTSDASPTSSSSSSKGRGTEPEALRKGKWTLEEENYANKIIYLFNRGILPIPTGTTLRCYLSETLRCDPMRITKKFAGASCIGKQVFQQADDVHYGEEEKELCELESLRVVFHRRVFGVVGPAPSAPSRRPSYTFDDSYEGDTSCVSSAYSALHLSNRSASTTTSSKYMRDERDGDILSSRSRANSTTSLFSSTFNFSTAPEVGPVAYLLSTSSSSSSLSSMQGSSSSSSSSSRTGSVTGALALTRASFAGRPPRKHTDPQLGLYNSNRVGIAQGLNGGAAGAAGASGSGFKRVVSAPDLGEMRKIHERTEQERLRDFDDGDGLAGDFGGGKRSHSMMDFETYVYDDDLAGDLLLQLSGRAPADADAKPAAALSDVKREDSADTDTEGVPVTKVFAMAPWAGSDASATTTMMFPLGESASPALDAASTAHSDDACSVDDAPCM